MSKENNDLERKTTEEGAKTNIGLRKFLKWLIIVILAIFTGVYIYASSLLNDERNLLNDKSPDTNLKNKSIIRDIFFPVKKQINFVILGVDEDKTRTDVMMIGTFKSKDKTIDILSVPRDIYVKYTEEEKKLILDQERLIPMLGYLKLNEVHHYPAKEFSVDFITAKLESIFDIKFDYYVKIDMNGFRHLVDGVGGIEFDVPQRMYYVDDWNGYTIDLESGLQILDGDKAEQLIRYRQAREGYEHISPNYIIPDIQRNKVQRDFLKAFIAQVIKKENIVNNTHVILSTLEDYITTNFNLNEVPKYLKYAKDLNLENISTGSIPTQPKNVNGNIISYLEIIDDKSKIIIDEIFNNKKPVIEQISSIDKKIQILNSTGSIGLAKKEKERLDNAGFSVINIDDYEDEKLIKTRIYIKKEGMGQDLLEYYKKAEIIYTPEQEYYDIIIILGKDNLENE